MFEFSWFDNSPRASIGQRGSFVALLRGHPWHVAASSLRICRRPLGISRELIFVFAPGVAFVDGAGFGGKRSLRVQLATDRQQKYHAPITEPLLTDRQLPATIGR